ncbi:serum response factor-binding protein 1 [Strongylocentrotus purpuratus]|uniref:Serum response factor-binding protein 1 n=1 Tax=Strongylocentrotus purpuratus TaxID=7668 RepID=A0A7M7N7D7_STRPU|nr:serum response factor-binding protein 1 [Strongylocentrotus purpuratus]
MDKVQFNTQMVNMRKTVKRAKVQLIHHLTRQIMVVRKKKGSGQQLVKNERRAGRLVKEIEVIKDLPCDEVTMSAVINKQSLQAVLDNGNSTAEQRGTARLIHHKVISQQIATFKDLVTDDLLEIGKRKEKLLSRTEEGNTKKADRRRSESSNEEEEDSLEEADNASEASDNDGDETKASPFLTMDTGRSKKSESTSLSEQNQQLREQMESRHKKSGFFTTAQSKEDKLQGESDDDEEEESEEMDDDEEEEDDVESIEDMDDDIDDMGENFNSEFRELSAEIKKGKYSGHVEKERKKSKGLDSLFVGRLSGKGHDSGDKTIKGRKNRPGQTERHKINIKKQINVLRRPSGKEPREGSRHVALVDLPSLDAREKQPSKRKVIPGINALYEKPKTGDSSNEKVLPSQRSMVSKRGRGGARGGGRGGGAGGGGRSLMMASAQAPEALHPSWEAKKKKKEQESKILPFEGKKITFDD